jgi:hypothetical protein
MPPRMTPEEIALFSALVGSARRYLEFGTGGSTVLAAQLAGEMVISLDSSQEWLAEVRKACAAEKTRLTPQLVGVDIGPVGRWGYPADPATAGRWPAYHRAVWQLPPARDADLCLVDGRFRVACFLQAVLNCRADTLILLHDCQRAEFAPVHEVARQIACVNELAVFLPRPGHSRARLQELLAQHAADPR